MSFIITYLFDKKKKPLFCKYSIMIHSYFKTINSYHFETILYFLLPV